MPYGFFNRVSGRVGEIRIELPVRAEPSSIRATSRVELPIIMAHAVQVGAPPGRNAPA